MTALRFARHDLCSYKISNLEIDPAPSSGTLRKTPLIERGWNHVYSIFVLKSIKKFIAQGFVIAAKGALRLARAREPTSV